MHIIKIIIIINLNFEVRFFLFVIRYQNDLKKVFSVFYFFANSY